MTKTTESPPFAIPQLSDEQRRGGACAFCCMPVSTGSAVDLGERKDEEGIRIFPRAHSWCMAVAR